MPFPQPPSRPNRGPLIAAGIGALAVICGVCAVAGYFHDKKNQETYGALTAACDGRAVAGARSFTPGAGVHRTVGANRSSGSWRINNSRIPNDHNPQGVSDAELVACFEEETETVVGRCEFYRTRVGVRMPGSDRSYPRVQRSVTVRLVEAATGRLVSAGVIRGTAPRDCNGYIGRSPSASDFRGGSVGSSEFGPWLTNTEQGGGVGGLIRALGNFPGMNPQGTNPSNTNPDGTPK